MNLIIELVYWRGFCELFGTELNVELVLLEEFKLFQLDVFLIFLTQFRVYVINCTIYFTDQTMHDILFIQLFKNINYRVQKFNSNTCVKKETFMISV